MMKRMLLMLWAVLATGCASAPPLVPPDLERAAPGLSAAELAGAGWTARPLILRLRQTARFTFRGREVVMLGMMELDTRRREARLVAVNEMGVKLFDLSVTGETVAEHYLLAELARYPRFAEAVAISLRRLFLEPEPHPADALQEVGPGYGLRSERQGRQVLFLFGGEPVRLVEKRGVGEQEDWRAVYRDYRPAAGLNFPRHIVLEDRLAGYRLELRIEKVRQSDEPTEP